SYQTPGTSSGETDIARQNTTKTLYQWQRFPGRISGVTRVIKPRGHPVAKPTSLARIRPKHCTSGSVFLGG
ncbi:hypothetical protein VS884_26370, partial [Escherichia coli]